VGTTLALLWFPRGSVYSLSVAPRASLGVWVWPGKRESPTRRSLLPLNAGTAEPFRVSPPEAVAYPLELPPASPCSRLLSSRHSGQPPTYGWHDYAMIACRGRRCCLIIGIGRHGPKTRQRAYEQGKKACSRMVKLQPTSM
jgi:hypothetical protein